jgi:hypothetical protein
LARAPRWRALSEEDGQAGGITEPFRCLGFTRYESHEGERPMAIRWRLERPSPGGVAARLLHGNNVVLTL